MFGPVTLTEIAFAPLLVFFVVRIYNTFPLWIHSFAQPALLGALVLSGWMMLTVSWSKDPVLGWDEIDELRWFVLVGLLYPVIQRRIVLIFALTIGVLFGQLGQLFDAFDGLGIQQLAQLVENHPGRIGGYWQPAVGGSILVAGLGLHLPAAMWGSGRARALGWIGSGTVLIGIIATGTRGAWIASALLIVGCSVLSICSRKPKLKSVLLALMISVVVIASSAYIMRDSLSNRVNETRAEFSQILDGDYDSYTGLRVKMGQLAIESIQDHPVIGVGAGGYRSHAMGIEPNPDIRNHAHNSFLHVWSTLGLIGVLIWIGLIAILLRNAWRISDLHASGSTWSIYHRGPMVAIVGILLASITDSIQTNTQTAALLALLAALSPAYVPQDSNGEDRSSNAP